MLIIYCLTCLNKVNFFKHKIKLLLYLEIIFRIIAIIALCSICYATDNPMSI